MVACSKFGFSWDLPRLGEGLTSGLESARLWVSCMYVPASQHGPGNGMLGCAGHNSLCVYMCVCPG